MRQRAVRLSDGLYDQTLHRCTLPAPLAPALAGLDSLLLPNQLPAPEAMPEAMSEARSRYKYKNREHASFWVSGMV